MRRWIWVGFGFFAAMNMMSSVHAAPARSPLQAPLESLKATLAKELGCVWEFFLYGKGENCQPQNDKLPYNRATINYDEDGSFYVAFGPYFEDSDVVDKHTGELREADTAEYQQYLVVNAIAALFPAWKESHTWMRSAISRAKDETQSEIRIRGTTIWVSYFKRSTGSFPNYAQIILTTRKNLSGHFNNYQPSR